MSVEASVRSAIMPTYARYPLTLVRGEGTWVWDADGKAYLDFAGGIAVMSIGHSHPAWVRAVTDQLGELVHVSNLFSTQPQQQLAERLIALYDAGEPEVMLEVEVMEISSTRLTELGVQDMILLTNSHHTLVALDGYGLSIVGERPIPGCGEA